jgi:hypothetical protein
MVKLDGFSQVRRCIFARRFDLWSPFESRSKPKEDLCQFWLTLKPTSMGKWATLKRVTDTLISGCTLSERHVSGCSSGLSPPNPFLVTYNSVCLQKFSFSEDGSQQKGELRANHRGSWFLKAFKRSKSRMKTVNGAIPLICTTKWDRHRSSY